MLGCCLVFSISSIQSCEITHPVACTIPESRVPISPSNLAFTGKVGKTLCLAISTDRNTDCSWFLMNAAGPSRLSRRGGCIMRASDSQSDRDCGTGIQPKLRGKLYSNGYAEKVKNTEQRAPITIRGKILI